MRHDGKRKIERNRALVRCRQEHPDWSWQEVGNVFKIRRQTAQTIYENTVRDERLRT